MKSVLPVLPVCPLCMSAPCRCDDDMVRLGDVIADVAVIRGELQAVVDALADAVDELDVLRRGRGVDVLDVMGFVIAARVCVLAQIDFIDHAVTLWGDDASDA